MEEKNEWMYELHIHIRAESCKSELHQKIVKLNCKKILQKFFCIFVSQFLLTQFTFT